MTRTTRRILFYIATAIFIGASYIVLLYAQGYKYSFSEERFVRSGAIYLKANTTARVLLDGKEVTTTSLLGNSASIGGLLPATHTLSVQKEGYSTWQKKVTVVAGFVQDFTQVMLLPQIGQEKEDVKQEIIELLYPPVASPSFTPTPSLSPTPQKTVRPTPTPKPTPTPSPSPSPMPEGRFYLDKGSLFVRTDDGYVRIAGDVINATISDNNQKLAWFSDLPTGQAGGQIWVYWFSDTNYQPIRQAGDIALVAHFPNPITAAQWFRGEDHIALDVKGLKVIEIDTRPGLNIINF